MSSAQSLIIVGGGAAGLASAIFAAQEARTAGIALSVTILDSARSLGAKILVSGGARCNVTHHLVTPDDFNGHRTIIRNILAGFDHRAAIRWFESLGVFLKREESGKLFPITDSSRTVLAALLNRCAELGVEIRCASRVTDIAASSPGFVISHGEHDTHASAVILCTGGRSLPKTGSDGSGYQLAQRLGHSITETWPALVPLVLDSGFFHAQLSGIALPAELTTLCNGKVFDSRTGSLLWTHFGISGPLAMDASRHFLLARAQGGAQLRCNLLPTRSAEAFERDLLAAAGDRPNVSLLREISAHLPERVAAAVIVHAQIDPVTPLGQMPRESRRRLIRTVTALDLPILRDRGWDFAEVTAGGVPLGEIDFRTMASRRCPGLYLAGEILDCDGRIGGFNFQWAWSTGHLAGRAAVRALATPRSTS